MPSAVRLHDPAGCYSPEQVQRWLTAVADGLAWQARHNRSATDLQLDQWWRPVGQRATALAHAALVAILPLPGFTVAAALDNARFTAVGGALLLVAAVAYLPPSPSRLAVRELTTRRGIRQFAFWLVLGAVLGAAGGVAVGLQDSAPQVVGPRDVVRADGRYGLVVGVVVAVGVAAVLWAVLGVGLTSAADAWTRYHISVVIAATRGSGPMRFGAFLDWALQAGLLRVSGVAYQFRHRQLQDWLTSNL